MDSAATTGPECHERCSEAFIGRRDFALSWALQRFQDTVREIYSLSIERLDSVDFMTGCLKGDL